MPDIFYNRAGRVRSLWRLAAFGVAFLFAFNAAFLGTEFAAAFLLPRAVYERLFVEGDVGFIIQSVLIFTPAALVGWACARGFEDLPWRALGWALHHGWLRDALAGLLVGGVSIALAALVGAVFGGYRFGLNSPGTLNVVAVARTLVTSGLVFLLGAAAEEMLFRGYPLQTLMRSWPLWVALLPVSVPFAVVHLWNPNVVPGFTFANTVLAGVWLGVAYWRTRSLWFPLGVHTGWNWVQGAFLGSPVSGITQITPAPLLRFVDAGPHWLGGGTYGIEGGAACTLALLISTLFIWRTRLLSATPELKEYTDAEIPNPDAPHVTPT
ncbi:MAG TPA: CPBP family glutamic-type intramembrane protease [Pyrinomonadaceae bacterium]|nr:CPBP family glutamic-type intramembrane protease [Pyrinomonadaceae bacterium]